MQVAHRLEFYAEHGPFGLTKLYSFVKRGMLPARKIDGTLFVVDEGLGSVSVRPRRSRSMRDASATTGKVNPWT